jgi:hypothetical protein
MFVRMRVVGAVWLTSWEKQGFLRPFKERLDPGSRIVRAGVHKVRPLVPFITFSTFTLSIIVHSRGTKKGKGTPYDMYP